MRKGAEGIRDRDKARRQTRAYRNQSNLPGVLGRIQGSSYRRQARKATLTNQLNNANQSAQQQYIANALQNNPNFANAVAGGNRLTGHAPDAGDLQKALAGAQFTIEKAEADEIQAHHATIDTLDEGGLNQVLSDINSSNTQKAAALQRLVQIGSMESIAREVDKHGASGESNVITRTLAQSLAKDGPGFLKASDIDNIARGQLGKEMRDASGNVMLDASGKPKTIAATMDQITEANVTAGVMSQEKMVAANTDELTYVSKAAERLAASGDNRAQNSLEKTAANLMANETLKGKIKHNALAIEDLSTYGRVIPR